MKRTKIAAIDVGTTKICTIMADTDDNGLPRILGVGIVPSAGLQKGMVVNFNEARQSIRDSVRRAEQTAGYRLESACVGVTGRHVSSLNNHGVIAITRGDRMVHPGDLRRVLDVARSVEVPGDRELLHVIPRTYAVDGQDGVSNPVGMHGFRLDVDTHIITASVTSVQNLAKCIRSIGVDIDALVLEPLASAEAVLWQEERLSGVMLADIGGGTTDIAIYRGNSIYHTSILPVAGYQVSRDISVGLDMNFEMAEEMKKKYASVIPGEDMGAGDTTLTVDGHSISYRALSDIVRVRVEELLRLILLELPQSDYSKLIPAGVVLTGGTANLPGIDALASDLSHLPVRIGAPLSLYGISDTLSDPAYATAVGLLLWNGRKAGIQTWQQKNGFQRFVSRMFR